MSTEKPDYKLGIIAYETIGISALNVESIPLCNKCNKRMMKYIYEDTGEKWWGCEDCDNFVEIK